MARKTDKLAVAEFPLIDEALLKLRIYTIRGVKVMLDAYRPMFEELTHSH